MELTVKSGQPEKQRTACVVAGVYEPRRLSAVAEKIDTASNGYLSNLLRRGDIEGKLGQVLLLHNVPGTLADRILLIGCGKERDLTDKQYKQIITKAVSTLNETGSMEAVSFLTEINLKGRDIAWKIREAALSSLNCLYTFDQLKSKKENTRRPLRKMVFNVPTRRDLQPCEKALNEGIAISHGMDLTRDLGNTPANICTPSFLANEAEKISQSHEKIQVSVLEKEDAKRLAMGLFLSVANGSEEPLKFITLEYQGTKKEHKPVVLVGKGITFDTGGNSLKPAVNMIGMKFDMCGAASVLGVFKAVSELNLPINLVGIIPSCENMISSKATRPNDVVTSMSGKTVEILNTDAEGRLILADALTYAERYHPDVVIDIATLTGAIIVALGHHTTGLFSNHNPLAHELNQAAQVSGDKVWQLPIWEEYQEALNSPVADIANIPSGMTPAAGSITAACFLSKFAKKYHWAHLDVAGTATIFSGEKSGATGRPVPLLMQFLIHKADSQS